MSYKITVIEDNEPDVLLLEMALERAGLSYTLTTLRDGAEARNYFCSVAPDVPDLILMDMNLPKVDGMALLSLKDQCSSLAHVPVVVWSSVRSEQQIKKLESFQVERFITKPASLEEFLLIGKLVRELIEQVAAAPKGFGASL